MDVTLDSIRDIRLYQPKNGYRFSVDSLLLFDFVNLRKAKSIADLGAGSGIIGILLAGKYPEASVDLFELQDNLAGIAEKNVILNRCEDRVRVIKCDLRELQAASSAHPRYDLVVSNPPFRRLKSGRLNIEEEKAIARHEITLRLHECINAASALLRNRGRLCMIYHPCRLSELLNVMRGKGIEAKRMRFVHSTTSSEAKMVLLEAVQGGRVGLKVEEPLYVYGEDGRYTEEMERIYKA
jgi:tRNA1Val (adenine37-N6)-methyltransferase